MKNISYLPSSRHFDVKSVSGEEHLLRSSTRLDVKSVTVHLKLLVLIRLFRGFGRDLPHPYGVRRLPKGRSETQIARPW